MGAGIAQLGCAAGMRTLLHDPVPDALRAAGPSACAAASAVGREGARATEDAARRCSSRWRALEGLAPCELVIEAAPERARPEARAVRALSRGLRRRRRAGHQHLVDPGDLAGRRRGAARERRGHALLQPAAADAAARGDPRRPDRRARAGGGPRGRRGDGQAGDPRGRRPRLPREPLRPPVRRGGAAAAPGAGGRRTSRSTASAASAAASGWARSS